jgi:hypothetical protein
MDDRRQDKSDGIMRAEIERLRAELWVFLFNSLD